jgi:glycosyltransferase involved in cell wall biosynthesis
MHMGGVEQLRRTIIVGLPRDRFEHLVVCTKAIGVIPEDLRMLGVRIEEVGTFRRKVDLRAIRRAYRLIKEFRPDIVHAAVFEGIIMGVIAGRAARVPFIVSEETSDAHGRRWTGNLLSRMLYLASDRVIAVSGFVESYLRKSLKLGDNRVRLIPNAVRNMENASGRNRLEIRNELGLSDDQVVFATLGRLHDDHKGVSDAIRALARITIPATLLVIGDGPDRTMLESLAAELGVSDRTIFSGYVEDPRGMLLAADALLHPARYEAFGLSIAEAMFAGLPVVATPVGGIPDVVDAGVTAILVEPRNIEDLSRAMIRLANDEGFRHELGSAGKRKAENEFGVAQYLARIEELYKELPACKA